MKVAVAGANGFLGRNIGSYLARNGLEVLGLVRKGRTQQIVGTGMTPVVYDGKGGLSDALKGIDCVVDLIGISRQTSGTTFFDVNYGMTKMIVDSGSDAGVSRVVYASGLGVDPRNTESYFLSKHMAEEAIRDSGLTYTLLRPSYILGPGDELISALAGQIADGEVVVPGSGRYRMQPIHVEDVARLVVAIIKSHKMDNRSIDVVGRETVSYLGYVRMVASALKKRPAMRFLSLEAAYQRALRNPETWFSTEELDVLVSDFVSSSKDIQRVFGIVPRGVRQSIADTIRKSRPNV